MQVPNTVTFTIVQFERSDQALPARIDYRITIDAEQRQALTPTGGFLPTDAELRQAIEGMTAAIHEALPVYLRDHVAEIQEETRRYDLGQPAANEDPDDLLGD